MGLPLVVAGSELAQALLDRFAPRGYEGAELLTTSHAGALFALSAIGALIVAVGFAGRVVAAGRWQSVPVTSFALVPPLLFVTQEHIEYWVGHGGITGSPATQRAFLLGLALQLPFAVAAYLVARLLVRLASLLACRRAPGCFLYPSSITRALHRDPWIRRACLRGTRATRGPPVSIASL